jgi:hypothetical protein
MPTDAARSRAAQLLDAQLLTMPLNLFVGQQQQQQRQELW